MGSRAKCIIKRLKVLAISCSQMISGNDLPLDVLQNVKDREGLMRVSRFALRPQIPTEEAQKLETQ